jgi:flavin-dependent dehydrogenase
MIFAAEHDVLVLGAGPAGSSAAIRLAEMGLDVGLIERCGFPRSHVGICIADETVALIDALGLGPDFSDGQFWRRILTAVRWGDAQTRLVPQNGYHVDRAVLDARMVARACRAGASLYQPAQVQDMSRLADLSWAVAMASGEAHQLVKARFVVDAAGRHRAIRGARIKDGPALVSVHADWALKARGEFDGLIEAGEDAWLWFAQTARDRAVVSVFCDPRRLRAGGKGSMQAKYSALLAQFRALTLEQWGQQCSDPQACDAGSQHAEDPVGDRYIRLGDSCLSVDPLSSQGVHLALQSGLQGAAVVNTILRKPENAEAARRFFRMRVAERVDRYTRRTKQEYARAAPMFANAFWRDRAGDAPVVETEWRDQIAEPARRAPPDQVAISPDLTIDAAPVIEGDFVEVRRVVRHPSVDGAIAYIEGADLVRLLSVLPPKLTYRDIPAAWQGHVQPAMGSRIASWLWDKRMLVRTT